MPDVYSWLLEDQNPAVQYRTLTELLGQTADTTAVRNWICSKLPVNWWETKGLQYRYYVTALAECGLSFRDIETQHLNRAYLELENDFEQGCADFMLLGALTKLGLGHIEAVKHALSLMSALPDGGFLCARRLHKLNYTPKSCYKANVHALIFAASCCRSGIDAAFAEPLAEYFLRRDLFYRTDSPQTLVLDIRPGWRSIDAFHPFEVMRVGIHNILEAMCTLGYGNHPSLIPAWEILEQLKDGDGRISLAGTLTKSYLPKERVGQPSKWVTFYALLAEKHRSV